MLEYTPSHLSHCNNLFPNSVQTRGVKMCTSAAVGLGTCPIWPQMRVFWAVWFVCLGVRGEAAEAIFHLLRWSDILHDMMWYDMMTQAQLWDGPVWKMWWQSKRKTRLWSDIWEREGAIVHVRGREREKKVRREWSWGERKGGGRGKNDRKSDALKGNEDEQNSQRELIWLGREEENGVACKDEWTVKKTKRNKCLFQ